MKRHLRDDYKYRKQYKHGELYKIALKFLQINLLNRNDISEKAKKYIAMKLMEKLERTRHRTSMVNRCVVSGRARSSYRIFGVSRMLLKGYQKTGLLPGFYKKSR